MNTLSSLKKRVTIRDKTKFQRSPVKMKVPEEPPKVITAKIVWRTQTLKNRNVL